MERSIDSESYPQKLIFKPVTLEEKDELIIKHLNSKATGRDGIPSIIIEDGKDKLKIYLMRIINLSILKGKFPNRWRIGKVIFQYKEKGYKYDVKNYRLVCLLSICSKLLKRVIAIQIEEFMNNSKQLNPRKLYIGKATVQLHLYNHYRKNGCGAWIRKSNHYSCV